MRFSTIAAVFSIVAGVSAGVHNNSTEYITTEVVTKYTTYCPLPTTIVQGNKTYTVTTATTLTITNCPCTITKTYTTVPTTVPGKSTPVHPTIKVTDGPAPTLAYPNTTYPVPSHPVANTTKSSSPTDTPFTGGANRATVAAGALAGLIGVAAYLL